MNNVCVMETGFGALLTAEEEGKKNELVVKLSKINVKNSKISNETINKEHDEGIEIDDIVKKEGYQTKDNEDWSPNAINSLLNAWCNHYKNEFECSKLNVDHAWKEISKEVSGRSGCLKKPKDLEQCKLKLKAMKGRYNREKMAKKFNPNEPSSWEWYDTMNTLLSGTSCSMNNLMGIKNTIEGIDMINNTPSLITYYDVKDKHIEKHVVVENIPTKSPLIDVKGKLQDNNNEENISAKIYKDQTMIQYNNLSTPTSPKSPRNFMKVKWKDSSSSQMNLIDKHNKDASQEGMSNSKPTNYHDEPRKVLLVNEIKGKLIFDEQSPLVQNGTITDRKGKDTLNSFDSCSNNSTSYNGSDILDQDSATPSPTIFMASQSKYKVNKCNDMNSIGYKNGKDKHMNRLSVMELSRSINCNYKQTCVESATKKQHGNENKEILEEKSSIVGEHKFHNIDNSRRQDENLATNIERRSEQMALSIARADSEAHTAKVLSSGSPMTSVTSQSGSSYSSKQRKILRVFSRYKYERENRSTHTLITSLMRASNNVPGFKKRIRLLGRASHAHEPNLVTALMAFGAMIQQLEKNQIVLMERVLNEQSNVLNEFVKTLKYNDQTREVSFI